MLQHLQHCCNTVQKTLQGVTECKKCQVLHKSTLLVVSGRSCHADHLLSVAAALLCCVQGISGLREVQALCASVFTFGPNIC